MRILMLPLVLAMSACSLTPPLVKPQAPVAAVFPDAAAPEVATGHAADLGWRTMFGDPRLQHLIALALEHNRDLRLAALNVEAMQAQLAAPSSWPAKRLFFLWRVRGLMRFSPSSRKTVSPSQWLAK